MGPPGGPGLYANSYADLRALDATQFPHGYTANVAGYAAPNDGGAGYFVYDTTSIAADNDGTILSPANGIGRWIRNFTGAVSVKWFGAKGDDATDDLLPITHALNYANRTGTEVFMPDGTYLISDSIVAVTIADELSVKTLVLSGTGGCYQWGGAGSRLKVMPSVGAFPKGMLVLQGSRFVEVRGIRFIGIASSDAGSSGIHYNNFNQGAAFHRCGFESLEMGIKVGNLGEVAPTNDDFCKYDYCEWLNCKYAMAMYGTNAYGHKIYRSIIDRVEYVVRCFRDAAFTSMNSFALIDSFVGELSETLVHIEGNCRAITEVRGNVMEVTPVTTDMPRLYAQPEGSPTSQFFGQAVFQANQVNWNGAFGTTTRAFIEIKGVGTVNLIGNKFNVLRAIGYIYNGDPTARPLFCTGNEWSNQPAFFQDTTRLAPGYVMRINDRHVWGTALGAGDNFPAGNIGSIVPHGLDFGWKKIAYRSTVNNQNIDTSSLLIGDTPGTPDSPALSFVTAPGTTGVFNTTADTSAGSPIINVASNVGAYLGMSVFITGVGPRTVIDINDLVFTVNSNIPATLVAAPIQANGLPKIDLLMSQDAVPAVVGFPGSIAIHRDAAIGEPSAWLCNLTGVNWFPLGIMGAVQAAAQADSTAATVGDLVTDFNALLAKLRAANLMAP